jgi:hypothetical protein
MTMRGIHAVEVFDQFAANREKLADVAWGSRIRVLQIPSEFAQWLILLGQRQTKSYLEIGISTGGSFLVTDAYLRATVPDYQGCVGYDVQDKRRDWDEYTARFPNVVFRHEGSGSMDLKDEQYDAAFIDARHLERWVLHDYGKVKDHARLVAFHDIELWDGEKQHVKRAWERIQPQHDISWTFIDWSIPPEGRCGIGAVQTN